MRAHKTNILWVVLLGVLFAGVVHSYFMLVKPPLPYKDVEMYPVVAVEGGYIVEALFTKVQCTFKRLEVFGDNTGRPQRLVWGNADGSPDKEYDRSSGKQWLSLRVDADLHDYETLEIRTRHDCGGEQVDKVFAIVELPT
jgi:hypothetical protein